MSDKAFEKELARMDSAWSNAPKDTDLPEGIYTATIQSAEMRKSQKSGNPMVTMRFVVADGEHLGAQQNNNNVLNPENPVGMSILKKTLTKLCYEIPETMAEVADILADVSKRNPIVTIQVKKSGEYTNVYVLELVSDGDAKAEAIEEDEAPVANDSDDAEFAVGDDVTFEAEGATQSGKITEKNKDGTYAVETEEANWPEVAASDLTKAEAEADAEPEADPELLALAQAHEIKVAAEAGTEALVAAMKRHSWKRSELTDDEIALLETHGIKTAAVAQKPVAKAPAKPAPTKAASVKRKK